VPRWAQLIAAAGAVRVAVGIAFYLSGQVDLASPSPIPVWAYALLSTSFAFVGGGLMFGNKQDPRAAWLGGVLMLLGVPLSARLLAQDFAPTPTVIERLRPDALLAAFLWQFVAVFPSPLAPRLGRTARYWIVLLTGAGLLCLALTLSIAVWPRLAESDWRTFATVGVEGSLHWRITFVAALAALLVLLSRLVSSAGADRFRLSVLIGALVVGFSPLFLQVIVEESWPAFKAFVHQPGIEPWVGLLLFSPMAAVPLVTAYSALFDRVVDVRLVLRAAAQYLLARMTIIGLTAVPFAALALFLFQRRTESLASLLSGPRPAALLVAIVTGGLALRLRRQWLHALDLRYFREQHDTQVLLTHLMAGDWLSQSPAAIGGRLTSELDAAFHARADLFVLDGPSGELRHANQSGVVLNVRSMLATLLTASAEPMDVEVSPDSPLVRLPDTERQWLRMGDYRLLVPLRARTADLLGLLALGPKRSELPYALSDRRALAALATPVALALENDRLRSAPESVTPSPASECLTCSRLHTSATTQCSCGGTVAEALAPYILRGVYRFERRLGAGGMGVVYVARDLALQRLVAIKTLPQVSGPHEAHLRAEAQAMASIVDANLAVIYGIETWRGMPFLVEEYLEGGTLADRLGRGPLPIDDALALGATLAGALARMHDAGIVHCDIKPSNIGFAGTGVPKLIDFGLAHLLQAGGELRTTIASPRRSPVTTVVTDHGLVGTPPYMSPEALSASKPRPDFDVWALSVVLFEAVAGRRPFDGRDFTEVSLEILTGETPQIRMWRPDCSDGVAQFFAGALSRAQSARPASAKAMEQALLGLRAALP
jgi:hypothetical protein